MALLLEKISEAMQHNEEMKKGLMKSILMLMMEWKSFEGNLDLTAKCLKQCFNELETKDQHLASVQESVVESSKELNLIRESVEQKRKEVEGKEEEFRAFRDREIRDLECKWKDFTLVKTEFDEAVKLREVKLNDQEKKGELLLGEIELGRKRLEDTFTEISMKENEFEERSKKMNKILTRIREESDSLHLKERKFAEQVDEFQMKQKLFHSMEKELESKERNLDFARKELVVKENSLKKEVREKEHILDSIQKELMEKETNFDLVKNELKGKVTHLSSQLTIKEEHLSTMKKELELKDESLDTVKRKLEFQEQDLNSLKERLQLREGECDSVIEVYRKRLEELDSREKMVEQLRVESEFKLKQLERLGKSMEKRFKHISMKEENFGKYRVSKKVQSWILEKSNALDERLEEVQIKEKILESTKKDLETKQRSLDSWRKELTIMESYLDSVKKDLGVKEDVAQFQVHDISQVQEPMTRKRLASDSEDVSVHEPLQQHWNFKRLYQLPIHAEIGQEANIDSNSLPSSAQSSSQATAATIHSTKLFIAGPSDNTEARPSVSGQSPEREQKPVATAPETTNEKSPILSGTIGKESKEMFRHFMLNMPCVSTKGNGPNEKKIEGFLYGYNKGEDVKIVCVCHGTFLSPAEFVKHAGGGDVEHPLRHIVTNPSPLL